MDPKPLLILGRPLCGLWSLVFQVLASSRYAERHNLRPVVYFGKEVCFWEEGGYNGSRNAWEYLFEPVSSVSFESLGVSPRELEGPDAHSAYAKLNQVAYASNTYLWDEVGAIGVPGRTTPEQILNLIEAGRRYIRVRPNILAKVDVFQRERFGIDRVVGVHYRGTDKHIEAATVPWDRYAKALDAEDGKFFVGTDTEPFLHAMRNRYGDRVITTEARRSNDGRPVHLGGGARSAEEALIDTLLLSRCNHLYHGTSNVLGGVLIFNPSIRRTDLSQG